MTRLVRSPSPNHGPRPAGAVVSCVVLHATASAHVDADVAWCCTPRGPHNDNPVSYHCIVGTGGTVYDLVPAERRAWHAGVSSFAGVPDVNDYSLGLSFANPNDGHTPYPETQLAVAASIVAGWIRRFPHISLDRITTHRAIALPKGRKTDPCPPAFDVIAFRTRVARELAHPPIQEPAPCGTSSAPSSPASSVPASAPSPASSPTKPA